MAIQYDSNGNIVGYNNATGTTPASSSTAFLGGGISPFSQQAKDMGIDIGSQFPGLNYTPTYTINNTDTLDSISKSLGVDINDLTTSNPWLVNAGGTIRSGQTLSIPKTATNIPQTYSGSITPPLSTAPIPATNTSNTISSGTGGQGGSNVSGSPLATPQTTPSTISSGQSTPGATSSQPSGGQGGSATGGQTQDSQNNNPNQITELQKQLNDIRNKYTTFFGSQGNSTAPDSGGDARTAITSGTTSYNDPTTQLVNTAASAMFQDISNRNNYESSAASVQEFQNQTSAQLGIPAMQTQLMNIQNVMNGTDQDVRNEITAAGGFATESQVEGIVAARNKSLLVQASNIQNALGNAQTNLGNAVSAYGADRTNTLNSFNDHIQGDQTYLDFFSNLQKTTNTNNDKIISSVGYKEWAGQLLQADPSGNSLVTGMRALGFPVADAKSALSTAQGLETYREQTLQMSAVRLGSTLQLNDSKTLLNTLSAANDVIGQQYASGKNPLQNYNASSQLIARLQAAYGQSNDPTNKNKAASDLDLIDSYVKIANSGQALTEAQVNQYLSGLGISAKFDVASQKITGSGSLSPAERKSLYTLANGIYKNQGDLANTAVGQINSKLQSSGINFQLNSPADYSTIESIGNPLGGTYSKGQVVGTVQDDAGANVTLTSNGDGSFSGSDGQTYDSQGNPK